MSEWKTYKLGDLIECIIDNRGKSAPISISNYQPIIEINALGQREVNYDVIRKYVSKETYDTWFRAGHPKIGDILFSTVGTIGLTSLMTQDVGCIAQNIIALRVNDKLLNNQYLYYFLNNKTTKINLNNLNIGGVQPSIKLPHLLNMPISLPPLTEQKRIADILSAIDDKIELNRRINVNLEQQAQALYKSWFVDADTTGWGTKKLADFFNVITGKKDANYSTKDGVYPFFTCSQDILKAPNYSFEGAAILLAGNGDFNVKRYIGKFEAYQRTYVLIPFEKRYHSFLYLLIKYHLQEITGGSRGSVIKFITKGNIADFTFTMPPYSIDEKLSLFDSLFNEIDKNITEINNLSTIRDTLLPKLMSGEIKV